MRKIYMEGEKNEIFAGGDLPNISFISHVCDNPDWTIAPVKHNEWCEVLYINRGKAYYTIDTKSYTVSQGDIVILNAGVVHAACSDREEPVERWSCAFRKLQLKNREFNQIIPDYLSPVIPVGKAGDSIDSCFRLILDACTSPSKNTYNICQHAICTILSFVDDRIGDLPETAREDSASNLAREIIHYIDNHYALPLTLESLAREFFISTDYLSHIIKMEVGISPINYLINRRIGESQHLLLSTMLPIGTIAEMVGYPNINHFSSAFKKRIGIAPGQFRQQFHIASIPEGTKNGGKGR
ncbi:helix-turn-helix domain-containing protein [Hominifimenecus sp. rT4P-3]|uniref:helix-turn-helix domain-containing protein n=1 Tax=Hominifimenecus sp. rT4P-3 TaxID=3242979 RepID=UPI003DA2FC1E